MNHTEEDIKVKVIIPWLKSLGFVDDELSFEKSFRVNLGRYAVEVNTSKQIETSQPRLDILVTRNSQNLFVVEVKRDGKTLTDADKEQAISYARLVHPIAPLAVVTNGRDFKIYKVGDKKEIDGNKFILLGYKIEADIDKFYEDIVANFIGYSPENVRMFCDAQVAEGIRTLLGSREKRDRKFIPDLYVPSKKLMVRFQDFLQNDKAVFAIVGESGSGKTCAMCGLALEILQKKPVLFYRALNLTGGIIKSISDDFNWEFSSHYDEISLFKQINKIFRDNKIIIFIDAVDEWDFPGKVEDLGRFAAKIKNRNFKLVLSCKNNQWNRFIRRSGIPTTLSEEVFPSNENNVGYFIEPFDDEEFHGHNGLLSKYRKFYDFDGGFESEVLDECKRSPFLLRVFFEVASKNKHKYTHLSFTMKEFYDEYYQSVMDRIHDNREAAETTVKEVARLSYEKNVDAIDFETLRNESGVNASEGLMSSLYEANILEKVSEGIDIRIRFYFQKLRDYIIAFGVKRWDRVPTSVLREDWSTLALRDVQLDAVCFFYPFAEINKKRTIDGHVRTNAEKYLDFYIQVLNEHFSSLKHRFEPRTEGEIGFIGTFDLLRRSITAYSFRDIKKNDERIALIPDDGSFWNAEPCTKNVMDLMGASHIHASGSSKGFIDINVKEEVLKGEIASQLAEIVESGRLNENATYYLSLEKVLGIIVKWQKNIHGIKNKDQLMKYFPISIENIEYGFRYHKAKKYYEQKAIDEKIERGLIRVDWRGSTASYCVSMSDDDYKSIHKQAHEAASAKVDFETHDIEFRKVDRALKETLTCIKQKTTNIAETVIPQISHTGRDIDYFDHAQRETLISCIVKFYTTFLQEYKILIETNFPTLKNHFSLYSKLPIHYFLYVEDRYDDFCYRVYECSDTAPDGCRVTLCRQKEEFEFDQKNYFFKYQGKQYKVFSVQYGGLSRFHPSKNYMNYSIPSEFAVLRSPIYEEIQRDLPNVMNKLFGLYGVNYS